MASAPKTIFPVHREFVTEAMVLRAIGHPLRLRILKEILSPHRNVTKICQALGVSQAVVSHHLAVLRDAGIVTGDRKGAEVFYSIDSPLVERLIVILEIQQAG
jgi:DNA-binding transcriptional ArsR family regulator